MAVVKNQYGTFETDKIVGSKKLPSTPELDALAQKLYGKNFSDLTIPERTKIKTGKFKKDPITFEQYLDDFKKMAEDPEYEPKYVKPLKGTGPSIQQARARAEAAKTIPGFTEKLNRNIARRKRIKRKLKIESDPKLKQIEMAKKGERRRKRRVAKLSDKGKLTPNEKFINFQQSLITRQLNDKIKANPNIVLKNEKLMDQLSTTVSKDGDIIKIKPNLSEITKRGIFEVEHQRDIFKKGAMKDFPYNRNLILGPHNRNSGFKLTAEKFIEKNPNSPKVDNILKVAEELKITLQPNVPAGTFKTKGLGYSQIPDPVEKYKDIATKTIPEISENLGLSSYTKNLAQALRGLGVKTAKGGKYALPAAALLALTGTGQTAEPEVKKPEIGTPIKYDSNVGAIVNENTDQPATQNQILTYIKDNPLKVTAGTSLAFAAEEIPGAFKEARKLGRGKVRSALGITGALKPVLTTIGTPAMTALFEAPFAAKRLEEGETATEILTDPLGPALGVAFMEPFSRGAGVIRGAPKRTMAEGLRNYFNLSNVGQARPELTSKVLRLGMSPRMIAGASRFLGIPGLLLGAGLSGYDAYKNYQNQEGFLYNLLNKDE